MPDERLKITKKLTLPLDEFRFRFSRASGPGGQNVNKVNTKAELRFDVHASPTLSGNQKRRIATALSTRMTKEGEILVTCGRHRSQNQNREECLARFAGLLHSALARKKARRLTRPTIASRERRLKGKREQSSKKKLRGRVRDSD